MRLLDANVKCAPGRHPRFGVFPAFQGLDKESWMAVKRIRMPFKRVLGPEQRDRRYAERDRDMPGAGIVAQDNGALPEHGAQEPEIERRLEAKPRSNCGAL